MAVAQRLYYKANLMLCGVLLFHYGCLLLQKDVTYFFMMKVYSYGRMSYFFIMEVFLQKDVSYFFIMEFYSYKKMSYFFIMEFYSYRRIAKDCPISFSL